ncbi:MAG: M24 family metallopeptidase [Vicinamibacterales bacterium]
MPLPASATLAARHVRLRDSLDALSLDALVVSLPQNIRYLTNHTGTAGLLVATRDAMHVLIDFRYEEAVRTLQQSVWACPDLVTWKVPGSYDEALIETLGRIGVTTVGFEAGHVTVARHAWLRDALVAQAPGLDLRPTGPVIEQARAVKDAAEIATLREAARRLTGVMAEVTPAVRPGSRERELAAVIESAMRSAGYERLAFDTIVASGPNAALPHYRAGDRRIAAGDLLVLDFGGVLDGYCCDLTRTLSIGPPSAEARRVYGAVLEAQEAAIAAVRPGIEASAVDDAARQVLGRHGLGEAFGHGTGHGLGLDVHEDPRISRPRPGAPAVTLVPGMVFTIEPGAYLPGWGGVRIEDDVLVTDTGCEVLTAGVPKLDLRHA